MSEALRFNEGKPKLSYFMRSFPKMAEAVARVKEFGANKYNEGNWRQGNKPDQEYWDSLFRHLNYIFDGEMYDQDSGCLHLGHAVWNLCALLELNYPDMPAVDEELFHERMAYWAHQKKLREAGEQYPCSEVEFIGPSEPLRPGDKGFEDSICDDGCNGCCPNGCGPNDGCSDCNSPSDLDIDPCPLPCDNEMYGPEGECVGDCENRQLVFVIEEQERLPSFQKILDHVREQMLSDVRIAIEQRAIEAELAELIAVDEVMAEYAAAGADEVDKFDPTSVSVEEIRRRPEPSTSEKIAGIMAEMDQGGIPIEEIRRHR